MIGNHRILFGDGQVGVANVVREGMFYKISCKCDVDQDLPAHVEALWQEQKIDLGLCVRMDSEMGLITRIHVNKVPQYIPLFRVAIKQRKEKGCFVPIHPEEPFRYLQRLNSAWLAKEGEELGIMLQDLSL